MKILNKLWSFDGNEDINTPKNMEANFILKFKTLNIGILCLKDGIWNFHYTNEFKAQSEIKPLIEFPDTSMVYESKELWPFFSYRIPGLSQPAVREIMRKEHIDATNVVDLLRKFGKNSVFNPFLLMPKPAY
jgi:HipA-like protein